MKIAYITAGAAGMYCGSCMHDNTLVSALVAQGQDALLIPTYTPITTDEPSVSQQRVFFGGINVYLREKLSLFRHTPWFLDRLLDAPRLLSWVSHFGMEVEARKLGALTVSILKGERGRQRKEVAKLANWLAQEVKPQIVNLTAVLLSGMVHEVKKRTAVPILGMLQGDDIFLESLAEPYRKQALELIRDHCKEMDGFIATCGYYADFMAEYLDIPRNKIDVVYPGLNLAGHGALKPSINGPPFTIGYFARICPEKGLHILAEAFRLLRQDAGAPPCRLRVSGWLGKNNHDYFDGIRRQLVQAGLGDSFDYVEAPDHAGKILFYQSLDVLSVPTTYREPKGLYVLEALANGVPVVQPRHGSFPALIENTGGGLLVNPEDPADLAKALKQLLENPSQKKELGQKGMEAVHERFHAERMAQETLAVYRKYVQ